MEDEFELRAAVWDLLGQLKKLNSGTYRAYSKPRPRLASFKLEPTAHAESPRRTTASGIGGQSHMEMIVPVIRSLKYREFDV
jgi:hypothetical protein